MLDWQNQLILTAACLMLPMIARSADGPGAEARLVLRNANVFTVDDALPRAEAVAVAADGTIQAVGDDAKIMSLAGPGTEVVDCGGRLMLPGFADAHGHFLSLGRSKLQLDLSGLESLENVIEAAGNECSRRKPGEWVVGRGWHQEKWKNPCLCGIESLPAAKLLAKACPNNPVLLVHASGHAAFANLPALKAAGIGKKDKGVMLDAWGKPTGTLWEDAVDPVYRACEKWRQARPPAEREQDFILTVETAARNCLENGVTFFQDAGSSFEEIDLFIRLADENRLPIRLWVMIGEDNAGLSQKLKDYKIIRRGQAHLTVRAIKRYADGALGSHGAWLTKSYNDRPKSKGTQLISEADLLETARLALENGFQLCTHAIGDQANRFVLDTYQKAFSGRSDAKDLRWRIEHAQHLDPADIPRFSRLGIVASMQASHCVSDGPWVEKRIGKERASSGAYAWRSLLDAGTLLANGTDTPVEPEDPIAGFYAYISRRMPGGKEFYPQQCISRTEAIRAMTINAARAAFEEDVQGSISTGKYADLILLSKNILEVPEQDVPTTRVVMTILGGKIVYRNF